MKILITGASGFIGSHLVSSLCHSSSHSNINQHEIICMTRSPESIGHLATQVKVIKADVSNYADLLKALAGIDVAFYLIHSMEGSSKDWKKFVERDRYAAENFGKCASECRVKRIIYLGGLYNEKNIERLSDHMRSR